MRSADIVLVLLVMAIGGANFAASKIGRQSFPLLLLMSLRFMLAGGALVLSGIGAILIGRPEPSADPT